MLGRSSDTADVSSISITSLAELSGAAPRRNGAWSRCVHWVVEARSHRVICLVAGIWLISGFDLALTILSHQQGVLHEENPVARQMLAHGPWSLSLYKIGLVLIGSYPLLKFRTARVTELGTLVVLLVYAILAVRWSACIDFYQLAASGSATLADLDPTYATLAGADG